jgi:hypothetical protein
MESTAASGSDMASGSHTKTEINISNAKWRSVSIELPHGDNFVAIEANIDRSSFWEECCELRGKEIRQWMYRERHAPWPERVPPKFQVITIWQGTVPGSLELNNGPTI